ncbi:MAG: hypothetical protein K0Q50_210 [Vampirovibrio sp.]|jgi:hypothetical protein|nr:hypothetical protein [Vampirovibrio sp.]
MGRTVLGLLALIVQVYAYWMIAKAVGMKEFDPTAFVLSVWGCHSTVEYFYKSKRKKR